MMLPARTCSPPNFFTPRRFDSESRPLRDEPPAFLCAISVDSYFLALAAGAFFAAALAGAASFVDALALGAASFFGAAAFSALGAAAFSAFGAAFSAFAGAAASAFSSAFGAAAFLAAPLPPIDTIFRIVCCWRWPALRR